MPMWAKAPPTVGSTVKTALTVTGLFAAATTDGVDSSAEAEQQICRRRLVALPRRADDDDDDSMGTHEAPWPESKGLWERKREGAWVGARNPCFSILVWRRRNARECCDG